MHPRVVIFDIDGTLLDTREFVLRSFEHAFAALGFAPPTREVLVPHIGRPLEAIYADFAGPDVADDLTEIHRVFQSGNLQLSTAYPGAVQTLARLKKEGCRMAAVTSRSRRTSALTLEGAGLAQYIEVLVSAEDAPALKPDPAPLLVALERLGLETQPTAMVGDTAHDIHAGKAIGAVTVAALYGFHGQSVLEATPDHAINSIEELPAVLGL